MDTRTRRTILDSVTWDSYPERLSGELSGGCSGTLVGRRVVLTAAHCVVNNLVAGWNPIFNTFTPRRDPFSWFAPFGIVSAVWYWVPEMYLNNNCSGLGDCNKYDIAVMVVEDAFGGVGWHPGWASYDVPLNGGIAPGHQMWGYPGCGLEESPASCTSSALYGDVNPCNFGALGSFEDPWNWFPREGTMSCDSGRGMSGSGVFRMVSGTPVVIGQLNQLLGCLATECVGNSYPNVAGFISPNYAAAIDYFKANNP